MEPYQLQGYYTYRSFFNEPLPVEDFNRIKFADRFAEGELFLLVQNDGKINGNLSFPAQEGVREKQFMDIEGKLKNYESNTILEFNGRGRPNTKIFDYFYEYTCSVAYTWDKGENQRLSLTGTLLRAQDHGSGEQIAKAGATASFIAVKRDFPEPRDIPDIAIIPNALSMIASKSHRLKHAVWHTLRGSLRVPGPSRRVIVWYNLDEPSKTKIRELGWGLERPPFTREGNLDLSNGAGEDFLFMHRKMITMIRDVYKSHKIPYIESWKRSQLPQPTAQQFSYSENDDPQNPGKKIYLFNPSDSGNMVPPAHQDQDEGTKFIKSENFFRAVMSHIENIFNNQRYLSALSLGSFGNLLEFTIHNWMHGRWSSIWGLPRDPTTGDLMFRETFDFDSKWNDPKYDYLGEFYSSHVHPLFWRLHGWVDDRIEDWFNAHEAAKSGEIERYEYRGVSWFKPGKWVQVSKPYYWPENHHHNHDHEDQQEIDNMLKVMKIIEKSLPQQLREKAVIRRPGGLMNFAEVIDINGNTLQNDTNI